MWRELPSPTLWAHRGAAAELPENTLASFRRAVELGAHALETDLHMTADGHVVVAHDPDGKRLAGVPREIRRVSLAELRTWDVGRGLGVPTLAELLEELPGVPLNVDLKQRQPSLVEPVVSLLRRMNAEDRVLVASFDAQTLIEVRRAGYRGRTGLGRSDVLRLLLLPRICDRLYPQKGQAAQVPHRLNGVPTPLATRRFIDRCHANQLRVDFWTVNDPAEARLLLALGADGIMTDDPAAIAPVFSHM
jgi:glycerophosphoryl diester phosphodiesterase